MYTSMPDRHDARATKILEAHHRFNDAFDGAMVVLDNVVQILVLPDFDGRFPLSIDRLQGGQIGAVFVHSDRLRGAVLVNCHASEKNPYFLQDQQRDFLIFSPLASR